MPDETIKTLVDRWMDDIKNRPWIAALCILGIVVIALASFTDALGRLWGLLPERNPYSLTIQHELGQQGHIAEFMGAALITSKWAAIISNNSDKPDSILTFKVAAHRQDGDIEYSGLYADLAGRVYDAKGLPIKLPVTLDPGHSTLIYLDLSVIMDRRAFQALNKVFPNHDIPSLQEANKLLAAGLSIDMFGEKAEAVGVDAENPTGFAAAVSTDQRNPKLSIEFQTARNFRVSAASDWYQGERARKLKPGERLRLLDP